MEKSKTPVCGPVNSEDKYMMNYEEFSSTSNSRDIDKSKPVEYSFDGIEWYGPFYHIKDNHTFSTHPHYIRNIQTEDNTQKANDFINETVNEYIPTLEDEVNAVEKEFDPTKDFEVSDDGYNWFRHPYNYTKHLYIGVEKSGRHVVQSWSGDDLGTNINYWKYIRNIKQFNASMLRVGEYMETVEGSDGKRNLVKKIDDGTYIDIRYGGSIFYDDIAENVRGRKVNVEINVTEDDEHESNIR